MFAGPPTISDLAGIETEHLLGDTRGPLVKIRCLADGIVLLGQVEPADAREIAAHLTEAAARAEYEADLYHTMRVQDWPEEHIGMVLHMVRQGEVNRHTNQGDTE